MNGAKIYHSKWDSRNYQMTSHLFLGRYDSIQAIPSSSFNSRFELNSHQIMNLLKSLLSPDWAYTRCCN